MKKIIQDGGFDDRNDDFGYSDKEGERVLKRTAEKKEISGDFPEIANKARRSRATKSLKTFLTTYFPDIFYLKFSAIHLDVISKIEATIDKGELYALAMPRGSGKTSICQCALVWAIVTGRAKCAVLVCSNQSRAEQLVGDIYSLVSSNEKLASDFPKEVYPFYMTSTTPLRIKSLTYKGAPIRAKVKTSQLIFPAIEGSACFESVLFGAGLTGSSLRGLAYTTSDGRKLRPDFVLCDDPQDRESANSPEQTKTRERLIKADMLGMAGAGKKLSCLITCTVIASDDLADRLLDRSKNPDFHGQRYSLLSSLPKALTLWEEYSILRDDELRNDKPHTDSNKFYKDNFVAMNEGAEALWKDRKDPEDVDALCYAMKLYFRDKDSFFSEYMNLPNDSDKDFSLSSITAEKCTAKLTGSPRYECEDDDILITGFIDVHKTLLYYGLTAWKNNFSGQIIDYGTFPRQPRSTFNHSSPPVPLLDYFEGQNLEDAISLGLSQLLSEIFGREYLSPSGTRVDISRILVDANWGQQTETVYNALKKIRNPLVTPSHGVYVGAKGKPFGKGYIGNGDKVGVNWRVPAKTNRVGIRYVLFDTNFWKSFFMRRLLAPPETMSNIRIFGGFNEHTMLLNHFGAEYFTDVEAFGGTRRVEEWSLKPAHRDNHFFDCAVGCCVGASMSGIQLQEKARKRNPRDILRSYNERYKQEPSLEY